MNPTQPEPSMKPNSVHPVLPSPEHINRCTTCKTPLLASYCGAHEQDGFIRLYHRVKRPWHRLRLAFMSLHTVSLDSPTWEQELDNVLEIEEERRKK